MERYDIHITTFKASDFLGWQRQDSLELSPSFQRRPVWKKDAKSYLIDTIVRGLPVPPLFIREKLNLQRQTTIREVVDGQQRLRTLFTFIDEHCVKDFDAAKDRFHVKSTHNAEVANTPFPALPKTVQQQILGYKFSTHILPPDVEDRDVLQIFARMNATGAKATHQELRNAEWFGRFKTLMYRLAYEQLDRWREWRILTEDQIARMREVELVSDLFLSMLEGLSGKTQKRLDNLYEKYDDTFPKGDRLAKQFRRTMDEIDDSIGADLPRTVFASEVYFFTLFAVFYDRLWKLGGPPRTKPRAGIPKLWRKRLLEISTKFETEEVPNDVLDAIRRASSDQGRRLKRFKFVNSALR